MSGGFTPSAWPFELRTWLRHTLVAMCFGPESPRGSEYQPPPYLRSLWSLSLWGSRALMSLTVWLALIALALAAQQQQQQDPKQQQQQQPEAQPMEETRPASATAPLTALQLPSSLNLSHNMVQTLAVAGAVVVGLVGAAAVLALVLPMFGIRLCYLLGTCDSYAAHAYLAPAAYDAYAYSQPVYASAAYAKSYDGATNELPYSYESYPQHTAQVAAYPTTNSVAANAYQKRSLEYVGPILKMLSNAYEKYNIPPQTKSVVESGKSSTSSIDSKAE
ncbi:Chromo domain-containing protein 1 [Frankliniella fusca]|uniref:Chromo domain-containing protein 1 n=1 Tax=Frankliniella fusca TaxID=407009 RepID=A0AAE1H156_9NEOP|nr:Chromo domain-containing protein 1 [Frankliniella fusca]